MNIINSRRTTCATRAYAWMYIYIMAVGQNLVPLVNIKIAGKWMFIPLKMVLIGIDPTPYIYMLNIPQYMLDAILTNVAGQTSLQLKRWERSFHRGIHRNSFGQLIWNGRSVPHNQVSCGIWVSGVKNPWFHTTDFATKSGWEAFRMQFLTHGHLQISIFSMILMVKPPLWVGDLCPLRRQCSSQFCQEGWAGKPAANGNFGGKCENAVYMGTIHIDIYIYI